MSVLSRLLASVRRMARDNAANIAMTLALSAIPLTLAMGAGVDYARGLVVHSNMADALDAAALAVGKQSSKPTSCSTAAGSTSSQQSSCATLQAVAQQFFNANFKRDSTSTGATPTVVITIANSGVTLSASDAVPTTFLSAAGSLLRSSALNSMAITASSTVVWGQTKLWVALVLDNSGSMASSGKMTALKSAAAQLITTLQNASQTAGDVEAGIVPFVSLINEGTSNAGATWLDWSDWEAPPAPNGVVINDAYKLANNVTSSPSNIVFAAWGPGDSCPFTNLTTSGWSGTTINQMPPFGYYCDTTPVNNSSSTAAIPSSGTYKGYICPSDPQITNASSPGNGYTNDHLARYFNGCWTSTKNGTTKIPVSTGSGAACQDSAGNGFSSSNCSCTGSGSGKTCSTQAWTHLWVTNQHSTWTGCVMDRTQDYDIQDTAPSGTAGISATNTDSTCPAAKPTPLSYDWTNLTAQINAMQANGATNQAIGLAHGWQMLTPGNPYSTPAVPSNTTRYIIILSDGLNTQDRWWGNGLTESSTETANIDARENSTCTAAKADGVVIYSLYVNINGSDGDSAPLQNCASDASKYFVVTSSADISTDFAAIAQQITNLRVAQ